MSYLFIGYVQLWLQCILNKVLKLVARIILQTTDSNKMISTVTFLVTFLFVNAFKNIYKCQLCCYGEPDT